MLCISVIYYYFGNRNEMDNQEFAQDFFFKVEEETNGCSRLQLLFLVIQNNRL